MIKALLFSLALIFSSQAFSIDTVDHYEQAIRSYNMGDMDSAFIHVKNALQNNPGSLPAKLLLGKIYFNQGNVAAAEQELTDALKMGADINLVLPLLGSALILQKKVDKLLQYEDRYYDLDKRGKYEWHLLRGQAYIINNKQDLAGYEFKQAEQLIPTDTRAINTLATFYLSSNKLDLADEQIKKSLAIDKNNQRTWLLKGELATRRHHTKNALLYFQTAHRIAGDDPKILRQLVVANLNEKQYDQARALNNSILAQSPNDPTAILIEAWFLGRDGKADEAKDLLSKLSQGISLLDTSKMLYKRDISLVRGIAEVMQGNVESAQKLLLNHLAKSTGDINALKVLAQLYIQTGQQKQALGLLEDKVNVVSKDLGLGTLLTNLYLLDNNLFRADQVENALAKNFPNAPSVKMLEARIYDAKGSKALALQTLKGIHPEKPDRDYLLLLGKLQLQTGAITQAQLTSDALLKQYPKDIDVRNLAATILLAKNQTKPALVALNGILKDEPANIMANFNLARLYQNQKKIDKARQQLGIILAKKPDHIPSLLAMAEMAEGQKEYKQAENWINKVLAYQPDNILASKRLADIYAKQQKWQDALLIVSRLLKDDRLNAELLLRQATIYNHMHNSKGAHSNYNLLYEMWLNNPDKLLFLARQQRQAQDFSGARKSLQKLLSQQPKNQPAQILLGRISLLQNKPEETQQILLHLQQKGQPSSAISELHGDFAQYKHSIAKAAEYYAEAMKLSPTNRAATVKLYMLLSQGADPTAFFSLVKQHITANPNDLWLTRLLADAYMLRGYTQKAEPYYKQLLNTPVFAHSPIILNNLANIYMGEDLAKALKTAQQAYDNGGKKNAAVLDTLGWILSRQGKWADGLVYLREAFTMSSKNNSIRYHLAYTLWKLDRKDEARMQLERALQHPDFAEYADAQALLKKL